MVRSQVEDMAGRRYRLAQKLGKGGQGEVYAVEGAPLAVKLLPNKSPAARESLERTLAFVRRLSLEDIAIARPLELLRSPALGYVMELLTEMKCWQTLLSPPRDSRSLTDSYIKSGGLRRRLRLLAYCADALNQLHGKGLVYSDLSPYNVLISAAPEDEAVYLVDADNLRYESSPGSSGLHTRGYGAPEIVQGKSGVNTLTDAYAFAVLAFQTLTLVHPLLGDWVEAGEPELQAQALAGEVPWVDHPEDSRNHTSQGFPRDMVLSPRLKELAGRVFLEGLNDPLKRPGIAEWAERLHTAADLTVQCLFCQGSYYYAQDHCPWCDTSGSPCALLKIQLWDPDRGVDAASRKRPLIAGLSQTVPGAIVLTERLVTGRTDRLAHVPRVELEFDERGDRMVVRSMDHHTYWMVSEDGARREVVGEHSKSFPLSWLLHLGPEDRLHRFVTFRVYRGERR